MLESIKEVFESFIPIIIAILFLSLTILILFTPLLYLEGKMKQALLRNQGIEISVLQAAFAPDSMFTNIELRQKATPQSAPKNLHQ